MPLSDLFKKSPKRNRLRTIPLARLNCKRSAMTRRWNFWAYYSKIFFLRRGKGMQEPSCPLLLAAHRLA
jgi:hypothetical protein